MPPAYASEFKAELRTGSDRTMSFGQRVHNDKVMIQRLRSLIGVFTPPSRRRQPDSEPPSVIVYFKRDNTPPKCAYHSKETVANKHTCIWACSYICIDQSASHLATPKYYMCDGEI